ncbi:hypothetical protein HYH03_016516 [Edaphochlamys debaryana]|uniref:RING-type domain-containing protein n=1 Tax=Edaphochlamys debaryana TaxID=47281 RepID=A0A835XK64_9CHLO|nr:hypothetical protein HYH03_016516 [Edaphochlamys debaryana]|eukprot:KAG2484687.1 hypothetical protein HYH03_016516 [Edaphochlamys debaryana]
MGRNRRALQDLDDDYGDEAYWEEEDGYYEGGYAEHEQAADPQPVAEPASVANNGDDDHALAGDVCAVCLSAIQPEELAIIKGCEHEYCVNCILQWAQCKEAPWCPQCKAPFNYLYTHRLLDGTLSDAPVEESVCLLKRAQWFVDHVKTLENGKAVSGRMAAEELPPEWIEYGMYDEDVDFDDELEQYYLSSAAGRARVVLGNRRLGENGFMRSGRIYARPANNNNSNAAAAASSSASIGKAGKGRAAATTNRASAGAGGSGEGTVAASSSGAGPSAGPSGPQAPGQGRRAKRNARRAAADGDAGFEAAFSDGLRI